MPEQDGFKGLEKALKMMEGIDAFAQADALFSVNRTMLRKHIVKPAQNERPLFRTAFGVGEDKEDKLGVLAGARVGGSVKSMSIDKDAKGKRKRQKVTNKVLLWEEYGTESRTTDKGANRGTYPKNPFFRQIVASGIRPIIKELNENYAKLAERYLKRKGFIK